MSEVLSRQVASENRDGLLVARVLAVNGKVPDSIAARAIAGINRDATQETERLLQAERARREGKTPGDFDFRWSMSRVGRARRSFERQLEQGDIDELDFQTINSQLIHQEQLILQRRRKVRRWAINGAAALFHLGVLAGTGYLAKAAIEDYAPVKQEFFSNPDVGKHRQLNEVASTLEGVDSFLKTGFFDRTDTHSARIRVDKALESLGDEGLLDDRLRQIGSTIPAVTPKDRQFGLYDQQIKDLTEVRERVKDLSEKRLRNVPIDLIKKHDSKQNPVAASVFGLVVEFVGGAFGWAYWKSRKFREAVRESRR